ncbi:putative SPOUT methyltransferase [Peptoanaerobacter stomatis]|uniref:Putative SPOUT methyltransferase n=1 Tax=Peptoanaerobacter stomatis TaxID=796937 RepID=J6HCM7_9FIRM|nr:23S rRNA (pseudouridine(1915)-N(3))-methyltransferase RlmH [Peptoanaerobacter stomatis]EJU22850.1 putative SPOUT methyltransferase [Peptoanaerobacter stomatis]NWO25499.1 23S rRNA (pseudouridine(1915)-N(3))-methyltransferase RlmH [Peptostreptococcaceae bacterium oral taxon 081]
MNITIYQNSINNELLKPLKTEYINRIKKYCNINIQNEIFSIQNKQYVIRISKKSNTISSIDFADKISSILTSGYSNIVFLTGDIISSHEDFEISVTKLKTSYEMEIIMLLEQIYRAFKINNNEVYHK